MEEARGPPLALGGPATQTLSFGWASPDDDHPPLLPPSPNRRAPDAIFIGDAEETAWLAFEWCGETGCPPSFSVGVDGIPQYTSDAPYFAPLSRSGVRSAPPRWPWGSFESLLYEVLKRKFTYLCRITPKLLFREAHLD